MKTSFVCFLFVVLALLSGCTYFEQGVPQKVSVYSFPSGADVVVSGEVVGQTPLEMRLPRKISHDVVLRKAGYKPFEQAVVPTLNEHSQSIVRFRLAQDLGFYYDLRPSPVEVQMIPEILPASKGIDPFAEMTELVLQVDQRRERGELDAVEHKYIVGKIIQFYSE